MEEKKSVRPLLKDFAIRALSAYSAISFIWVLIISAGINNSGRDISAFAERLVFSDLAIAFFSAVFGASFFIFRAKKMSPSLKRFLHIIVNYIAAMVCVYAVFSNVSDQQLNTWIAFMLAASAVYFIIYGVVALIIFLINRKK